MVTFAIRGPIARSDLPGLCERVCALLKERRYRVTSTGKVEATRHGDVPGLAPWTQLLGNPEENVYFNIGYYEVIAAAIRAGVSVLSYGLEAYEAKLNRGCRLHKVVIDRGCTLPEGMVIGEDAAEDAQRFYRTEEGVVLVTPEMLRRL